jgi:hypothetical protein
MKVLSILKRLYNGNMSYILGRFLFVRNFYSIYKGLVATKNTKFELRKNTLFDKIDIEASVKNLQKEAIALGLNLPSNVVHEINNFALSCELKADNTAKTFFYKDIKQGKLADGTTIAIAYAIAPENCEGVKQVLQDPKLYQIVEQYLGYKPANYELRLYYSVVAPLTDAERRARNQTIDYHFDVHALNFCYAHFYITDTDKNSGAHAIVKASHKVKPMSFLLGSARRSDTEILNFYQQTDVLLIEGTAGTGFLEDTSCYHKALAPVSQDRLLLQIRFF